MRNIIHLSLKHEKKAIEELSKDSGVPKKELEKFLEILIKEKKLICNVPVRDTNGNIIEGTTIPVYGVWHED